MEEMQVTLRPDADGVATSPMRPIDVNHDPPPTDDGDDGNTDADEDNDDAQSDITVTGTTVPAQRSNKDTPRPDPPTSELRPPRSPFRPRPRDSSRSPPLGVPPQSEIPPLPEIPAPREIPPPPISPSRSIESGASEPPIAPPTPPPETPPLEGQVAPPPRPVVTPPPPPRDDRPMTPPPPDPPRPQTPEMPPPPPPRAPRPGNTPPPPDLVPPTTQAARPLVLEDTGPKQQSPQHAGSPEDGGGHGLFQESKPGRENKQNPHTPGLSRPGSKHEFVDIKQPKPIRAAKWDLPSPARTPENPDDEDREHFRRKARHFPPLPPAAPRVGEGEDSRVSAHDMANHISTVVSQLENVVAVASTRRSRRASTSSSETDVIPHALQDSIQKQWNTLKEQRDSIFQRRLRLATSRKLLRELRARVDEADNSFMGLVRKSLVRGREIAKVPAQLEKAFEESQRLRSEYHALEVEYEEEEVVLDDEEEDINRTEMRFFALLVRRESLHPNTTSDTIAATETDRAKTATPEELRGITSNGPHEETHPLYRELVDVMGDYCMTLEEHQELMMEKSRIDYDVEQSKRLKRPIDEEDEEFLSEFESQEIKLREDMEQYRSEVFRLRSLCKEKGVMRRHIPFRTEYIFWKHFPDEQQYDIGEDIDLLSPWNNSDILFPRLVSRRKKDLSKSASSIIEVRESGADAVTDQGDTVESQQMQFTASLDQILGKGRREPTSKYINNWLCEQLEDSPHLAYLFYQSSAVGPLDIMDRFHAEDTDMGDGDKWLEAVMDVWWTDGGNSTQPLKGPLTGKLSDHLSIHVHAVDEPSRPNTPRPGDVERSLRHLGGAWKPFKKEAASVRPTTALVGVMS